MKRLATFLLVPALLIGARTASAEIVNAFTDPGTTAVFTSQRSGNSGYTSGDRGDMIDDPSLPTSWIGYAENAGTGGSANVDAKWVLTFAGPAYLHSITSDLTIWSECAGTTDRLRQGAITLQYQDQPGGAWNSISSVSRAYGPDGGDGHSGTELKGTLALDIPQAYGFLIDANPSAFANNAHTNGSSNAFVGWKNVELNITPVPEPSSLVLLGILAFGLMGYAWRRGAA